MKSFIHDFRMNENVKRCCDVYSSPKSFSSPSPGTVFASVAVPRDFLVFIKIPLRNVEEYLFRVETNSRRLRVSPGIANWPHPGGWRDETMGQRINVPGSK